ncbi:hypothetical protein Niako_1033 [Niastella koreensis GR20-10]|uniref:Uncharacterized protein n=2 Tax=Niastella koreensis TaxID=354356 RepID=G8TGI9_NIAKG|nr:hypothetical protein [Niastella koreensis]AEV97412.1 hypothetical protein Niako_1033 [Niastella koreensis GR20-10]
MTTDIDVSDTYFIIKNSQIAITFVLWLLIVVFLFRMIRRRHQAVNKKFVVAYTVITALLLGLFLGLGLVKGDSAAGTYNTEDLDALMFRNQLKVWCMEGCLLVQVIFLIYFFIQMVKKPVPSGV